MEAVSENPIRALTPFESIYETSNELGCLLLGYELQLASKQVLDVELFRKSLEILQRKVPTFDLCIKKKDGKNFFYKMASYSLDFEVFDEKDSEKILQDLIAEKYNSEEGPLWRSRLFIPGSYVKESNSYKYKMAFGFHHGMCDGTSNVRSMSLFLSILNDLIEGKSVSEEPVGGIYDAKWYVTRVDSALEEIENNLELKKKVKESKEYIKKRVSALSCLEPFSKTPTQAVAMRKMALSPEKTQVLIQTFKRNGCSVNSGFLAVVDNAILNIVTKRGLEGNLTDFVSYEAIDTRRYNPTQSGAYGFQAGIVTSHIDATSLKENGLWGHASQIDKHMKDLIKSKHFLYDIDPNFWNAENADFLKVYEGASEYANFEYTGSNMGNISSFFQEEGRTVTIDTLFRTMDVSSLGVCFNVLFHTLHGKLLMTFGANSNYVSKEVLEEFCKEILIQFDTLINE